MAKKSCVQKMKKKETCQTRTSLSQAMQQLVANYLQEAAQRWVLMRGTHNSRDGDGETNPIDRYMDVIILYPVSHTECWEAKGNSYHCDFPTHFRSIGVSYSDYFVIVSVESKPSSAAAVANRTGRGHASAHIQLSHEHCDLFSE